jgi:hypothetical protein
VIDAPAGLDALLAPLRALAASRVTRVRLSLIESLARRAAAHDGEARRLMDERLGRLVEGLRSELADGADQAVATVAAPGPLAALARRPGRTPLPGTPSVAASTQPVVPTPLPAVEPEALQYFRRTWSRLSAEQRLAQSHSALPGNAGPLHSQHLVHRSLMLMREVSPEYFERFLSHVDTLLWLESANAAGVADATAARATTERRAQAAARAPRVARTKADPQE